MVSHHQHLLLHINTLLLMNFFSPAICTTTLHVIDGVSAFCEPKECPPGTQAVLCGPDGNIICESCPSGTYQDNFTQSKSSSCRNKRVCSRNSGLEEVKEENGADLTRTNRVCRCMTELGYQDPNYRWNKSAEECLFCTDQGTVISGRCVRCTGNISVNEDGHKICDTGTPSTPAPSSVTDNKVTPPIAAKKTSVTASPGAVHEYGGDNKSQTESHNTNGISAWWITIIIPVVLVIGIGGYYKLRSKNTGPSTDEENNRSAQRALLDNGQPEVENSDASFSLSLRSDQPVPDQSVRNSPEPRDEQTSIDEECTGKSNKHTQSRNCNGSGAQLIVNGDNHAPVYNIVNNNFGTTTPASPAAATEAQNADDGIQPDARSQSSNTEYLVQERSCTVRAEQEMGQDSHRLNIEGLEEN